MTMVNTEKEEEILRREYDSLKNKEKKCQTEYQTEQDMIWSIGYKDSEIKRLKLVNWIIVQK